MIFGKSTHGNPSQKYTFFKVKQKVYDTVTPSGIVRGSDVKEGGPRDPSFTGGDGGDGLRVKPASSSTICSMGRFFVSGRQK